MWHNTPLKHFNYYILFCSILYSKRHYPSVLAHFSIPLRETPCKVWHYLPQIDTVSVTEPSQALIGSMVGRV